MEEKTNAYNMSELNSLRIIGNEFWCNYDSILGSREAKKILKPDLGPLIKLQKSLNNTLMKLTAQMSHEWEMSKVTEEMKKIQISEQVIPDEAQSQVAAE